MTSLTPSVCWNCGYTLEERLAQGAEPGKCTIPREYGKDPRRCRLNADDPTPVADPDPGLAPASSRPTGLGGRACRMPAWTNMNRGGP